MKIDAERLKSKFSLTDKELIDYVDAFRLFDKDGDGTIDQKELKTVMTALGMNPTQREVENMVREADTVNADGVIEFEEFVAFMKTKRKDKATEEAELREAFAVFDKNGDGTIERAELLKVMTELGEKMTVEEVDEMIAEVDENGDGVISYDEFVTLFTKEMKDLK